MNADATIRELLPEIDQADKRAYWRKAVRMAALCHDLGHLPFSHAAEHELLPRDWTHETLSLELIRCDEMRLIWSNMRPQLDPEDVAKLAVGAAKYNAQDQDKTSVLSDWETIISEIVVSDAFGVDRMDYLLRDSLHAGVQYGRFDHTRVIDSLRILPASSSSSIEPQLGISEGGLHSAEQLLLARYFMFSQVYLHPIRRIYDRHLQDFLSLWLKDGRFSIDLETHLRMTDTEVLAAMSEAARDDKAPSHDPAERIVNRRHFKLLWSRTPADLRANPEPGNAIMRAAIAEFSEENVRQSEYSKSGAVDDFPVLLSDHSVERAQTISDVLPSMPTIAVDLIFVRPDLLTQAVRWLRANRDGILLENQPAEE